MTFTVRVGSGDLETLTATVTRYGVSASTPRSRLSRTIAAGAVDREPPALDAAFAVTTRDASYLWLRRFV